MATRSNGRFERQAVSIRSFAWPHATIATLRHSTLPWSDRFAEESAIQCVALSRAQLGSRDRLSLLAQFAAHQALLAFSGTPDAALDPAEWSVVLRRGSDCRLLRVGARGVAPGHGVPAITLTQQFADLLDAPGIEVLRHSWARPEAVFLECFRRLRDDMAADLRWVRRSGYGAVLSPRPEGLEALASADGTSTYSDELCIDALEALAVVEPSRSVIVIRGAGILRYSALGHLRNAAAIDGLSEAAAAEKIAAALSAQRVTFCVADPDVMDEGSRRVVQILASMDGVTWLIPGSPASLPETRWFVVSPRLSLAREIEERLAACRKPRDVVEAFLASEAFDRFADRETIALPDTGTTTVGEPLRSYIGALALLGPSVPRAMATQFLREFLCDLPLEELAVDGVSTVDSEGYHFISEGARLQATAMIARSSGAAIRRVAAATCEECGDLSRAATLLIESGGNGEAMRLLERVAWTDDAALIRALQTLPATVRRGSPSLTRDLTRALIDAARYREARETAAGLPESERELAVARVERRTGDYTAALARIAGISRSCASDLLRADILLVLRRQAEARVILATTTASDEATAAGLAYMRALAGLEGEPVSSLPPSKSRDYLSLRLATYQSLEREDFASAIQHAEDAIRAAPTIAGRIDAQLDRVFALFSAGEWTQARRAALESLADVEETQGDRAAGGLLFLLAYLCADDGQWEHARHRIERLRAFYAGTADERHLGEIELLEAHLRFSRGDFAAAQRLATQLLSRDNDASVRAAGELIVAECESLEGRSAPHVEVSANVEFRDRATLLRARAGRAPHIAYAGEFTRSLAAWEAAGGALPVATTGSEKLKLFRSLLASGRKRSDRALLAQAARIAGEMAIEIAVEQTPRDDGVRCLRTAATREFPFAPHEFDRPWRYAIRNRLGRWNEIGSLAPLPASDLERIAAAPERDWVVCGEGELIYFEDIGTWSKDNRDALAAIVRQRAELYRLRRAAEQESAPRPATPVAAGVIGESGLIRDVIARVTLVARRDIPICLLGESGTGKELIARAIHAASARRHKAFTPVNCAAFPETLIEGELFGHVRGAFTGADRDRQGLIEVSDGGTLFLDEIGEMPLAAQAKLLRFLQDGEFRRVGEATSRSADVRIVAATNRKLEADVESGRFRQDLYYRIRGVEVVLPALRDRGADILLLASHFLAREVEKHSGATQFSEEVESAFLAHRWPGNVRELQNTIREAHALAGESHQLTLEHLPAHLRPVAKNGPVAGSYQDAVARFRRDLIQTALAQTNGNQNRAAEMLRISRQALGYQIRELGIMTGRQLRRFAV